MDLNKDRLWTAYDETVTKIDAKRNGLLNGPLYKRCRNWCSIRPMWRCSTP